MAHQNKVTKNYLNKQGFSKKLFQKIIAEKFCGNKILLYLYIGAFH